MPVLNSFHCPSLRVHKATGQAYIYSAGKRFYLGRHDDPATQQKYHRLVAEMLATGGQLPPAPAEVLTVLELVSQFWAWAESYYRREDGSPSPELAKFRYAFRALDALYGHSPAIEFGPRAPQAVRQRMIQMGG